MRMIVLLLILNLLYCVAIGICAPFSVTLELLELELLEPLARDTVR